MTRTVNKSATWRHGHVATRSRGDAVTRRRFHKSLPRPESIPSLLHRSPLRHLPRPSVATTSAARDPPPPTRFSERACSSLTEPAGPAQSAGRASAARDPPPPARLSPTRFSERAGRQRATAGPGRLSRPGGRAEACTLPQALKGTGAGAPCDNNDNVVNNNDKDNIYNGQQ